MNPANTIERIGAYEFSRSTKNILVGGLATIALLGGIAKHYAASAIQNIPGADIITTHSLTDSLRLQVVANKNKLPESDAYRAGALEATQIFGQTAAVGFTLSALLAALTLPVKGKKPYALDPAFRPGNDANSSLH